MGDTVVPNGIELFDFLRLVEGRLYLFHVKEGLDGDHARAVCSQIRNGARKLKAALSGTSDFLNQFCEYVYKENKPICYRLRKQYPNKEDFQQMFREFFDRPRDQILFVCAFLDTHSPQRFLQESPEVVEDSEKQEVISSTVAKLELVALEQAVRSCGFGFKICQIERQGEGVASLSVVPPISTPFQELREFDLSEYQYGVNQVVRQETLGDGSCAFHSVLGTMEEEVYCCAEAMIRQKFFNRLTDDDNKWVHDALENRYQSTMRSLLGRLVRNELDASDRLFFGEGKEEKLLAFIQKTTQEIFTGTTIPQALLGQLDPDFDKRFKNGAAFFNHLKTESNGAAFLVNLGIPKLEEIGNSEVLGSSYKKRKAAIKTLAEYLETECWNLWRKVILKNGYFLSDDELAMIGYAYNKSIVLIQEGVDHIMMAREICDANAADRVFIHGDGRHYERCIPKW